MGKTFNASVDWLGMVENPDQDVNPSVNGEKAQKGKSIDDHAQRKWLIDWLDARKKTGRFEDQLNSNDLAKYKKNINTVQQLTRDQWKEKYPNLMDGSGANNKYMHWMNRPSGSYVLDLDEMGMDNPTDHHYFSEPTYLQMFSNMFDGVDSDGSNKIHELTHAMTRNEGSGPFRVMHPDKNWKDYKDLPVQQAIKNIPIGFDEWYNDPSFHNNYEGDPEEILAQLMEYRYNFNVDPNRIFTEKDIPEVMKNVKTQGPSGLLGLDVYEPKEIIRLLNEVASIKDDLPEGTMRAQEGGSLPDRFTPPPNTWSNREQNLEAKNYLRKYIMSPKYLERLEIEFPDLTKSELKKERDSRLNNLNTVKVSMADKPLGGAGYGGILGRYTPKAKDQTAESLRLNKEAGYSPHAIYLEPNPYWTHQDNNLHEYSHALESGQVSEKTKKFVDKITNDSSDYLRRPTEFVARLQVLRYRMYQLGLYDPSTEEFTEEHLKLMKNSEIRSDSHFDDIYQILKGNKKEQDKNLIKSMNEIADISDSIPTNPNLTMARDGGQLPKAQTGTKFSTIPQPLDINLSYDDVELGASFLPYVGEAIDAKNTLKSLYEGNYTEAGLHGLGFLLPFVPGKALVKGYKKFFGKSDDVVKKVDDEMINPTAFDDAGNELVPTYTSDGTVQMRPKKDVVRINRVEDPATLNVDTRVNYEDGNWYSTENTGFYNYHLKDASGNKLPITNDRKIFTGYMSKDAADKFHVSKSTDRAINMSGGKGAGKRVHPSELILPPELQERIRRGEISKNELGEWIKMNIGSGEDVSEIMEEFYKKFGGSLTKAQDGTEVSSEREKYIQFALDTESGHDYIRAKNSAVKKLGADGKWDGKSYYKIYEDGKYYPYYVNDEKRATIGHGHHPSDRDIFEEFKGGIDENKALELLGEDIDEKLRLSEIYYNQRFGKGTWDDLSETEQFMLNDYTFNVRGGFHKAYKKFAKAIHDKDFKSAELEYKRNVPRRNEIFLTTYLKPWMDIQQEKTTVAPDYLPLPIGTFPSDLEGNPVQEDMNIDNKKERSSWWRGEEGWIPDEFQWWKNGGPLPKYMDGAGINARGSSASSATELADGARAENAAMSRSAMDPMPSLNNDLTINDNLALSNTISDLSEETTIAKYGGQYMWGLDLRSTKAHAGKEVKSDDIYANDRYSQSAAKYKRMLPKYQSQGEYPKTPWGEMTKRQKDFHDKAIARGWRWNGYGYDTTPLVENTKYLDKKVDLNNPLSNCAGGNCLEEEPLVDEMYTYETHGDWFDNRAIFTNEAGDFNDEVRKKIYAGTHGFNPVTQVLTKLDEKQYVPLGIQEMSMSIKNPESPYYIEQPIQPYLPDGGNWSQGMLNSMNLEPYPSYLLDERETPTLNLSGDLSFREMKEDYLEVGKGDPDAWEAMMAGDTRYYTNQNGSINKKKQNKYYAASNWKMNHFNPMWSIASAFHPASWPIYAAEGVMKLPGDISTFAENPSFDKATNVALDLLEIAPGAYTAWQNVKKPIRYASKNISQGMKGVRGTGPNQEIWNGVAWVGSAEQAALRKIKRAYKDVRTLGRDAKNKVKGAKKKLKEVEAKMDELTKSYDRLGFDTKELQQEALLDYLVEYNKYNRGAKNQKQIIDDYTEEFLQMKEWVHGDGSKWNFLLDQIRQGRKIDADMIQKHLGKSAYDRFKNLGETFPDHIDRSVQIDDPFTTPLP